MTTTLQVHNAHVCRTAVFMLRAHNLKALSMAVYQGSAYRGAQMGILSISGLLAVWQ